MREDKPPASTTPMHALFENLLEALAEKFVLKEVILATQHSQVFSRTC